MEETLHHQLMLIGFNMAKSFKPGRPLTSNSVGRGSYQRKTSKTQK